MYSIVDDVFAWSIVQTSWTQSTSAPEQRTHNLDEEEAEVEVDQSDASKPGLSKRASSKQLVCMNLHVFV